MQHKKAQLASSTLRSLMLVNGIHLWVNTELELYEFLV